MNARLLARRNVSRMTPRRALAASLVVLGLAACGTQDAPTAATASADPAALETEVPKPSKGPPVCEEARVEVIGVERRGTSQLSFDMEGSYEVAADGSSPLAVHARLTNLGEHPLQYHAANERGSDPMFGAMQYLRRGWRDVPLGYCFTGVTLCSLAPSETRDVYLPMPRDRAPIRFVIPVIRHDESFATTVAMLDWSWLSLAPIPGAARTVEPDAVLPGAWITPDEEPRDVTPDDGYVDEPRDR